MLEKMVWDFVQNLLCAMLCGGIIGLERSFRNKAAGFRTMMLVCIGTTIFVDAAMILGERAVSSGHAPGIDRILGNIITGIGFLGAGSIFRSTEKNAVEGLTTAASIWYVAGIGMLIGIQLYVFAGIATALALVTLLFFGTIESRILAFLRSAPQKFKRKSKQ